MSQKTISPKYIKGLIIQHAIHGADASLIARSFKIARSTVRAYIKLYKKSDLVHADILNLSANSIADSIRPPNSIYENAKYAILRDLLSQYHQRLNNENTNMKTLWQEYKSIDEFGPVAIKIRGGRTFSPKDQTRTIPQMQKSKGSLICTAALELSTNQITHFYSSKKNTAEMIKLLELLLVKYATEERIYFSWDAASWHASKRLYERVKEVNDHEYRNKYHTPFVGLAPLPSSAQFLNVIESVFSGMAKAVIHNSDYQNVDDCKLAIDRHFSERNQDFLENPKRAGNKIWGKEVVKAVFKDSNNCKDPKYR